MCCKVIDIFLNCKKKSYICAVLVALFACTASAQPLNARYLAYIDRYREIAIKQRQDFGIPASITIAQGLLESRAGQSYLATRGNNHFGIKCHKWAGEAVEYDDTLKHECYRKYGSAADSFLDHSRFLKGKRYASLYQFHPSQYKEWAHGLKSCGYAEDPAYPQKLIALIEQYELYKLDPPAPNNDNIEAPSHTGTEKTPPSTEPKKNPAIPVAPERKKTANKPVPFPQSKIGKRAEPTTVPERTETKTADPAGKTNAKETEKPAKSSKRQHNERRTSIAAPLKGSTDN